MSVIKMSDIQVAANWAALKIDAENGGNADREHITHGSARPFYEIINDGAWQGRRCFIIGGGSSLRDFDWSLLDGELTIGINKALEKIEPTIMLSMDSRFYDWLINGELGEELKRKFENYKGYKVWLNTINHNFGEDVYLIDSAGEKALTKSLHDGLGHGSNSGYVALNLAMVLGANPIYLLGFDMKGDGQGKQSWWHGGYPVNQGEKVFNRMTECFEAAADEIAARGFRVINMNEDSGLKCFEFSDTILKNEMPLIISYYTKKSIYEYQVRFLKESLDRLFLSYDIQEIKDRGSWAANTYYKAEFIAEMLEKHRGRDLLWVDADAVMWKTPEMFRNYDGDLGVFYYRGSLSNGTIYLKNNEAVRGIVGDWVKENNKNEKKTVWEQFNFQRVVERNAGNIMVKILPKNYCYIEGLMQGVHGAVIEHFQASRILRGRYLKPEVKDGIRHDE